MARKKKLKNAELATESEVKVFVESLFDPKKAKLLKSENYDLHCPTLEEVIETDEEVELVTEPEVKKFIRSLFE